MYPQPQGAAYGYRGATKLNKPVAGTTFNAGPGNASFWSAAYGGAYNGAAALDGGSMYGQTGSGSMIGGMNEEIIVTKLFSSRRDLDRLASSQDFSRRFDSNWGSYRFAGADGCGSSLYDTNSAAGGSLISSSGKAAASFFTDQRTGVSGIGPDDDDDDDDDNDGSGAADKQLASETTMVTSQKEAVGKNGNAERVTLSRDFQSSGVANTAVSKASTSSKSSVLDRSSLTDYNGEPQSTSRQSATEAKEPGERNGFPVSAAGNDSTNTPQPATEAKLLLAGPGGLSTAARKATDEIAKADTENGFSALKAQPRTAEPIDDIPLLAEDVRPKLAPATFTAEQHKPVEPPAREESMQEKPPASATRAEMPNEAGEAVHAVESDPATSATKGSTGNGEGRHARPRSRPAGRPVSRLTSMSIVEFPEAEEMYDEMVNDGLHNSGKQTSIRVEQRRDREAAARGVGVDRQHQRQGTEETQKQHGEEALVRRRGRENEQQQRKELLEKVDEERKRERNAAIAARERQREEEKRRFEERKRMEDDKETARAATLVAQGQRQLGAPDGEAQEKPIRTVSRQRSRRPPSGPASKLRGAIPEQPPELVAGQIQDRLASESLREAPHQHSEGQKFHPGVESCTSGGLLSGEKRAPQPSSKVGAGHAVRPQRPQPPPSEVVGGQSQAHHGTPATPSSHATPQSQMSKNTRRSHPKEDKAAHTVVRNSALRPANMVKTLVLVEEIQKGNHALTAGEQSVSYNGHAIDVTEVRTRPEGNFNYHSSVVHDVGEAVCSGYNAAVLAIDAPNTASRFDSPVWSILNRIIRRLLRENSNDAGELRSDFELTCAIGYLHKDKVRDLLTSTEAEASFTKISVNPSPIYGPRLTNLSYDTVTDPVVFEDVLTTTLSRASEDPTLKSLTEGVVAAFVLIMQTRETDGKSDIYLSSFVVATAGDDTFPYQSAISHARNEYATVFHLVLGGPSCTCFMLNIADDDAIRRGADAGQESLQEALVRVLALLRDMSTLQNYDLRSGSVKRFIKYVELSHTSAQARLEKEQDEAQRRKVERYLREQERLLQDAYRLLQGANIK
ncbi:hypothetical protein JKF63_02327 [Porcisia hertigi]|uniref:Uncharacterized protein n=1 Tax=Porcisia hertigi TaxID=2761500 RepID=A0A836HLC8_9TRYP|nr:hypothetical protein JKF63_02327 [Porcisia hertigi]